MRPVDGSPWAQPVCTCPPSFRKSTMTATHGLAAADDAARTALEAAGAGAATSAARTAMPVATLSVATAMTALPIGERLLTGVFRPAFSCLVVRRRAWVLPWCWCSL